ncbi:MAG: glycosyltransferase family 2 protein [Solirubrobacteraceae bacterium]
METNEASLDVAVIVPTYRRPELLRRCLEGVQLQSRQPEQVIVVHRSDDRETIAALAAALDVETVTVEKPGVLAAMRAGVRQARGDVIAFLDDDTVPQPDWLASMLPYFADRTVGAVGGRDLNHALGVDALPLTEQVGVITRWGKHVGNHHIGTGQARDVDVLKAVGGYRRAALALPAALRGTGAETHFEIATCLWARRRGWRLVYDPAVLVDHFPGPRYDPDGRQRQSPSAVQDAAYNLVAAMLSVEPRLFGRRAVYGLLVGDRGAPGVARALAGALLGDSELLRRLGPSLTGQAQALLDVARGRRVRMVPAAAEGGATNDHPPA